jgi:type II secretory pathway predicted ATPase ExeA
MYEAFFGLREKPFSLLPDPAFLYFSRKHRRAFAMLEYGVVNGAPIAVITGEIGCGKTTLVRHLLNRIGANTSIGLISNTHRRFGGLAQWVSLSFDLPYRRQRAPVLRDQIVAHVREQAGLGRRTLLIVDEAQNMAPESLGELETLVNAAGGSTLPLQVLLVGQPELRVQLRATEFEAFMRRVSVAFHLTALAGEETPQYIRHRLAHAGRHGELFTDAACREVHLATGGVPRLINRLCDLVLLYAWRAERATVDATLVRSVRAEQSAAGAFALDAEPSGQ